MPMSRRFHQTMENQQMQDIMKGLSRRVDEGRREIYRIEKLSPGS